MPLLTPPRRPKTTCASASECGSVTVITAGLLLIVATIAFAVVKVGVGASNRAQAQAVADIAALAGASADVETAQLVVVRNGATVESIAINGDIVDVAVSFHDAQASARAERTYVTWNPIDLGPGVTDDLETTTIPTIPLTTNPAPTTTLALIFETISTSKPTTRAQLEPTHNSAQTKRKAPSVGRKFVPVPGTSPRGR